MLFAALRYCLNLRYRWRGTCAFVALVAVVFVLTRTPAVQSGPAPASLSYPTKEAFERHVTLTEGRNTQELRQGTPFLRADRLPGERPADTTDPIQRPPVVV